MTVDIIIPTYKPDETLCLLLHKLQGQTFVVHRVIILNTEEALWKQAVAAYPIEQVLQELPCEHEVIHIAKKDFDHGGTRQFGAEYSDADVMIFMTQDAVPADEHLIENLLACMEDTSVAVAYARQLARPNSGRVERMTRIYNYPAQSRIKSEDDKKELGVKTYFCSDVCALYRKAYYEQVGGFVQPTIFNEDMIIYDDAGRISCCILRRGKSGAFS